MLVAVVRVLQTVDPDVYLDLIKKLVLLDKDWIPSGKRSCAAPGVACNAL